MNVHRRLLFPSILAALLLTPAHAATPETAPVESLKQKTKKPGKTDEQKRKKAERLLREELSKRFRGRGNGTAKDSETGFLWTTRDSGTDVDWTSADKYCTDLKLGGRTNWRLPTIEELEGLYEEELTADCGGWTCHIYPPFELTSCCPWSSTKTGSSSAFSLYLDIGERNSNGLAFSNGTRALCVSGSK